MKRVKLHIYLGVDLYFLIDGKVQVSIILYLNNIFSELPEHLGTASASPADNHLFKIFSEEEAQPLPEEKVISFNHVVAYLLLMSSRDRRNIQIYVSFLITRVKQPDEEN